MTTDDPVPGDNADPSVHAVAARALELIADAARVGLGSGRAASVFIAKLGARAREGLRVSGVPTSRASAILAREAGIPLVELGERPLDITVDGADERVVATARREGRSDVGCIVLGRGADEQKVVRWLTVAASVPGFIGVAVGRTTFWDAVADCVGKRATRPEAVSRIARRYREWAALFARGGER